MERILALATRAAEEAEVFEVSSEETQVRFEANKLKQLQTNQQTSVALRIIKNGRLGYATATGTGGARDLVAGAVETAAFGTTARFHLPEMSEFPTVDIVDAAVASVAIKDMVRLGEEMISVVTRHTPGILCDAGASRGTVSVRLINSRGGQAEYRKTFFGLDIGGTLIQGTDMLFVGESESSCHPVTDAKKLTDVVLRQLERAKERATAPTRQLPVVFTPDGVTALLAPLMSAFNGKTVLEGASPVGDKLGKVVFDSRFSLHDDPTIPYRPGSRPCDDEGVPSRRTALVENGVVAGFFYDLQTAGLAGKKSTGNGSRGRGSLPAPGPSAFVVAPGAVTFDDMVQDMKEGLVIEQLMGAEQGNILGGDFSGNVLLGYKVENGKIVGRVKDTMVSGNVYQILKDIAAVGSESKWVGGMLQTPPIYCRRLVVSSKG
ncbi:MAG: peptidase C69 [Chloroflexi bacterium RBG_16_56_11]|nr:MAG: peptidase C69 [Chloroflexi bacterium RBG_16_56_11]